MQHAAHIQAGRKGSTNSAKAATLGCGDGTLRPWFSRLLLKMSVLLVQCSRKETPKPTAQKECCMFSEAWRQDSFKFRVEGCFACHRCLRRRGEDRSNTKEVLLGPAFSTLTFQGGASAPDVLKDRHPNKCPSQQIRRPQASTQTPRRIQKSRSPNSGL